MRPRHWSLVLLAAATLVGVNRTGARATPGPGGDPPRNSAIARLPDAPCLPPYFLPAYSHNDYRERHPLHDALALGYRGVEVDVMLVRGRLLVGHDRSELRPERTLESMYLGPLRERLVRCGFVHAPRAPFLLFVELKDRNERAYAALRRVLASFPDLMGPDPTGRGAEAPVRVILVGGSPSIARVAEDGARAWGVDATLADSVAISNVAARGVVRMISLDARRLPRWSGRGAPPSTWTATLSRVAALRRRIPGAIARVHHVRPTRGAYEAIRAAVGVDLIGTEALGETARLLKETGAADRVIPGRARGRPDPDRPNAARPR